MAKESKIQLFACRICELSDPAIYEAAYRLVTPGRREQTDRLGKRQDKCRSLGAELLLRYALGTLGISPEPDAIVFGAQGKPYLKNREASFNLSHSGDWVLCALAPGQQEVGCDIERIRPIDLKTAKRFYQPEEYAQITELPTQEAQMHAFFRYWTLKESFMKATGLGLRLSPESFRICLSGEGIDVLQSVDAHAYTFFEYTKIPGYACALAVQEQSPCEPGTGVHVEAVPLQIIDLKDCL